MFSPDGTLISASAAPHCGVLKPKSWSTRLRVQNISSYSHQSYDLTKVIIVKSFSVGNSFPLSLTFPSCLCTYLTKSLPAVSKLVFETVEQLHAWLHKSFIWHLVWNQFNDSWHTFHSYMKLAEQVMLTHGAPVIIYSAGGRAHTWNCLHLGWSSTCRWTLR